MARVKKPKPMHAQEKLTFLLSLVPFLIERERVSVAEVADHFGVDAEQIREAVRLIAVSGVPGETSTYQYEDLFDIAWDDFEDNDQIVLTNQVALDDSPRFSAREAAALIAGLQYLSALPENADRTAVASLMTKLSRGASAQPSPLAVEDTGSDATLALIRESVTAGTQLEFDYLGARGTRERRRVDPLRVESMDADWYLRGWDHLRGAVRTFRLDRISGPRVSEQPISHSAGDVTLPDSLFESSADDLVVTVDVLNSAAALLADYIPDGAAREQLEGRVRTTVRVSHYHGLKRLMAGMSGVATVVEPAEARRVVAEWAAAGAARYDGDAS
ncbi:helix-turn-helix transcriptional regulator [Conyzicola sp.]|uniref:helix-turn-helix transcriptional regulator n=1 Tax=Conyzicola sp. TaxID=1969404 RepID=UPI0039898A2B